MVHCDPIMLRCVIHRLSTLRCSRVIHRIRHCDALFVRFTPRTFHVEHRLHKVCTRLPHKVRTKCTKLVSRACSLRSVAEGLRSALDGSECTMYAVPPPRGGDLGGGTLCKLGC